MRSHLRSDHAPDTELILTGCVIAPEYMLEGCQRPVRGCYADLILPALLKFAAIRVLLRLTNCV